MPLALQVLTYVVPARYFLVILRGIILKGAPASELPGRPRALVRLRDAHAGARLDAPGAAEGVMFRSQVRHVLSKEFAQLQAQPRRTAHPLRRAVRADARVRLRGDDRREGHPVRARRPGPHGRRAARWSSASRAPGTSGWPASRTPPTRVDPLAGARPRRPGARRPRRLRGRPGRRAHVARATAPSTFVAPAPTRSIRVAPPRPIVSIAELPASSTAPAPRLTVPHWRSIQPTASLIGATMPCRSGSSALMPSIRLCSRRRPASPRSMPTGSGRDR